MKLQEIILKEIILLMYEITREAHRWDYKRACVGYRSFSSCIKELRSYGCEREESIYTVK